MNVATTQGTDTFRPVEIATRCNSCGDGTMLAVRPQDVRDWQDGKLAQDAFPYLSSSERELLISGTCAACWEELFGDGVIDSLDSDLEE